MLAAGTPFLPTTAAQRSLRVVAAALLAGMCLSPALWGWASENTFPALPFWGSAHARVGDGWMGALTAALLAGALLIPNKKALPVAVLIALTVCCVLDAMRLQPWIWCYGLLLWLGLWERDGSAERMLLAGIYFWSGLNKISPYFVEGNFSWFCDAFDATRPLADNQTLGYLAAVLEMLAGAALVWHKSRAAAAAALMVMHGLIVVFLLKLGWNTVVIPWNLALATLLWFHIRPASAGGFRNTSWPGRAALALVWLAPAGYWLGCWPFGLSWQLYSNNQPEATLVAQQYTRIESARMKQMWQQLAVDGSDKLLLDDWAYDALNVPIFVSDRSFRQAGQYLCREIGTQAGPCELWILRVNQWDKNAEYWDTLYLNTATSGNTVPFE